MNTTELNTMANARIAAEKEAKTHTPSVVETYERRKANAAKKKAVARRKELQANGFDTSWVCEAKVIGRYNPFRDAFVAKDKVSIKVDGKLGVIGK